MAAATVTVVVRLIPTPRRPNPPATVLLDRSPGIPLYPPLPVPRPVASARLEATEVEPEAEADEEEAAPLELAGFTNGGRGATESAAAMSAAAPPMMTATVPSPSRWVPSVGWMRVEGVEGGRDGCMCGSSGAAAKGMRTSSSSSSF